MLNTPPPHTWQLLRARTSFQGESRARARPSHEGRRAQIARDQPGLVLSWTEPGRIVRNDKSRKEPPGCAPARTAAGGAFIRPGTV